MARLLSKRIVMKLGRYQISTILSWDRYKAPPGKHHCLERAAHGKVAGIDRFLRPRNVKGHLCGSRSLLPAWAADLRRPAQC